MADIFLPVKNMVIEWRYPANLGVYTSMDQVGMHFQEEFPDWQRSALSLEIRNKDDHRRFFISHRRAFYDVNGIFFSGPKFHTVKSEIEFGMKLFDRLDHQLKLEKIERVGLRQWVAFEREESYEELIERSTKKFQPPEGTIDKCLHGTIKDVGYIADVIATEGWKYRLWAGPMDKEQWFEVVPHEQNLFDGAATFAEYKAEFPDRFLFCDIDCELKDTSPSEAKIWLKKANQVCHAVVSSIYHYFGE